MNYHKSSNFKTWYMLPTAFFHQGVRGARKPKPPSGTGAALRLPPPERGADIGMGNGGDGKLFSPSLRPPGLPGLLEDLLLFNESERGIWGVSLAGFFQNIL